MCRMHKFRVWPHNYFPIDVWFKFVEDLDVESDRTQMRFVMEDATDYSFLLECPLTTQSVSTGCTNMSRIKDDASKSKFFSNDRYWP